MKNLTNKKGFTLTELIVVIAIIGILAAVLIPSLTGYIAKAKDSAALQEAAPIVTAYETYLIEKETGKINDEFDVYVTSLLSLKADDLVSVSTTQYKYTAKNSVVVYLTIAGSHLVASTTAA